MMSKQIQMLHWKVKKRSTMYLSCNSKKGGKVEKISRIHRLVKARKTPFFSSQTFKRRFMLGV